VALSRDLASNNVWVESLERSLARRGRPRRASIELGKLTPPRDLSDPDNLAESVLYWRTRRAAASSPSIPAAGGATALALLAATTLPALTASGHSDSAKTSARRSAGRAGTGAGTQTQLVHHAATARKAFDPSATSGLGAAPAAAPHFYGKVIYGSVDSVQRMLGVSVDGQIGPATGAAIRQFQTAHGLSANGIVDQTTYDAMQAANPTPTQPTAAVVNPTTAISAHAASAGVTVAVTAPVEVPAAGSTTSTTTTTATTTAAATTPTPPAATAGSTTAATPTDTAAATTTAPADTTVATQPAVPQGVTALQAALHVEVDGTFGSQTKAAVEAFQSAHGLTADGVVGPETRAALGLGAGPTMHDTQPPPPPVVTDPTSTTANGGTTPAATSDASDTSPTATDTVTNTGEPANVAAGMAAMEYAAQQIATLPYIWGGGHGSWISPGYDCSGSVSYVLHAAGLLSAPETSSDFESYGAPGPGKYITIYATDGHVWMTLDGQRFDTVALSEDGSRFGPYADGEFAGYVERHPIGY
jgi:peptidoglycan hydrolase-like protein with peptidoglycan-binding domain